MYEQTIFNGQNPEVEKGLSDIVFRNVLFNMFESFSLAISSKWDKHCFLLSTTNWKGAKALAENR